MKKIKLKKVLKKLLSIEVEGHEIVGVSGNDGVYNITVIKSTEEEEHKRGIK